MSFYDCPPVAASMTKCVEVTQYCRSEAPLPSLRRWPLDHDESMRDCKPILVRGKWADCPTDSEYEEDYQGAGANDDRCPPACRRCGATPDNCQGTFAAPTASLLGLPAGMAISAGAVDSGSTSADKKFQDNDVRLKREEDLGDALFRELLWRCGAASATVTANQDAEAGLRDATSSKQERMPISAMVHLDSVTQTTLRRVDALAALLQRCQSRLITGEVSVSSAADAALAAALTVAAAEADILEQAPQGKKKVGRCHAGQAEIKHQPLKKHGSSPPTPDDLGLPAAMHKSCCAPSPGPRQAPNPEAFCCEPPAGEKIEQTKRGVDVDNQAAWDASAPPTPVVAGSMQGETCDTLRVNLQELGREHPERVICLRKINRLGFESRELLERHYSSYGMPSRILVAHLFTRASRRRSARMRPAGVGFMVMETKADAERILELGESQQVDGVHILVQRFEPPSGDGALADFEVNEIEEP